MKDRINKTIIILLSVVLILLFCSMITTIIHIKDYNRSRNSGNQRWLEVKQVLDSYDFRIKEIESQLGGNNG